MLAVQIRQQGKQVLWVVFIHRRVGGTSNNDDRKRRIPDQNKRHAQDKRIRSPPAFLVGPPHRSREKSNQQKGVGQDTGVESEAHFIDEEQFKLAREVDHTFDHTFLDKAQQRHCDEGGDPQSLPRKIVFLEIIN